MLWQQTRLLLSGGQRFSGALSRLALCWMACVWAGSSLADDPCCPKTIVAPDRFPTLVNPNCSHCVDEAKRRGDELKPGDNVLCWIRGYSNGGAIPYRFFLNAYPVISDSYGSFVADPYAGFARAYGPWYHYRFHGWHGGVMLIKDTKDGTIFSALSGVALEGPRKGTRLTPIPSLVSTWGDWLQQYPQAVAYHLYPKYQPVDALPLDAAKAKESRGKTDERLPENTRVLGVFGGKSAKAYLDSDISNRKLVTDTIDNINFVILWQESTRTAAAYRPVASPPRKYKGPSPDKDGVSRPQPVQADLPADRNVTLKYQPDEKAETAPYVDAETGSRWDISGRAVTGELKGWTLDWLDSVQVNWFAWAMEYPTTSIYGQAEKHAADSAPSRVLNEKVKIIAGTAEFLKSVPKAVAYFQSYDAATHAVVVRMHVQDLPGVQGDKSDDQVKAPETVVTLKLTPDAEIKRHGWWARPGQFKPGDELWVWFKTNRKGERVAISMMMDALSRQDMQGEGALVNEMDSTGIRLILKRGRQQHAQESVPLTSPMKVMRDAQALTIASLQKNEKFYIASQGEHVLYDQQAFERLRQVQQQWLRNQWASRGLPGTVTFTHIFNGELDVVLDHETMRWARSLTPGTAVQLYCGNQAAITGMVKFVQPQRERTLARMVVNGKDQSELNIGDRIYVRIPTPPASVDESVYPSDVDQKRNREERIEWFLASIYCTCGVDKDTCTGHVYTLSCCNPNGCGMPNDMRKQVATMIDKNMTDRAIYDALLVKYGKLLVQPHLKP